MGELALPSPNEPLDTEFSVRRKTVLLLGDTATLTDEVLPLLGELDLDVRHLPDPHTAAQMANDDVDLYLLDLSSVTGEVSLICDQLINRKPDRPAPVLVLAGEKETELLLEALRTGAEDYISKPVETHEVLVRIRSALCVKAWQEHARESRERVAIVARIVFGTNTGLELDEVVSPVLPQISRLAKGDLAFVIVVDHDGNETDRIFPTIKNHKPDLGLIEPLIQEAVRTKYNRITWWNDVIGRLSRTVQLADFENGGYLDAEGGLSTCRQSLSPGSGPEERFRAGLDEPGKSLV